MLLQTTTPAVEEDNFAEKAMLFEGDKDNNAEENNPSKQGRTRRLKKTIFIKKEIATLTNATFQEKENSKVKRPCSFDSEEQRRLRKHFSVSTGCCRNIVGRSSQAIYLMRNSAMDDSIGGS